MAKVIILGGDNPELISEEIRKRAIEGEVVIINGEQEQKLREQINNGEIDEDTDEKFQVDLDTDSVTTL